jgi:hypothetical protein
VAVLPPWYGAGPSGTRAYEKFLNLFLKNEGQEGKTSYVQRLVLLRGERAKGKDEGG